MSLISVLSVLLIAAIGAAAQKHLNFNHKEITLEPHFKSHYNTSKHFATISNFIIPYYLNFTIIILHHV